MTERASLSNVSASHRAPQRPDPEVPTATHYCAGMQRLQQLNDQLALLLDQERARADREANLASEYQRLYQLALTGTVVKAA